MNDKYNVYLDSRYGGAGKTHYQIQRMVQQPGLYLFVADRKESIAERRSVLLKMAEDAGIHGLQALVIHSGCQDADEWVSVRVAIESLPSTYRSGHVVVLVCHEGLKSAELSGFGDWHVIIDEAPSLFDKCSLRTSVSAALLSQLFNIEVGADFNRIVPSSSIARRDLHLDSLASPIATLHARAADPRNLVVTHLASWDELAKDPRWTWWSLWSPAQLARFASATILAAAFERSLAFRLCQALAPELGWLPLEISAPARPYKKRRLTIRYFAEQHGATRHRFDTRAGKSAIAKIASYLALRPTPRIWTCNKAERPAIFARLRHGYLPPKQAGSNAWSHIHEAAILYTSKPDGHELKILAALNVDADAVIETRERDVIYQFVARTSLRDPECSCPVTAYVYDKSQAEALALSFAAQSGLEVELELVDLGFAQDVCGRDAFAKMTPEQRAERKRMLARERKRKERSRPKT